MEQQFCPKADFLFGTENGKGHWKNTLEKTKYLLGGSPLKDPGGKHAGKWWQLCKSSRQVHTGHCPSGFLGFKQCGVVLLSLCQACGMSCKVLLSLFPRTLRKISSVGLWWVTFFIILKLIFALYFVAQVGPPRRGCSWFERCWRNDWREWGQGNPLSEVGQFYVATFIISNFFLSFLFSWTVSSPQVLTYKLSGKSEEAKIWTEKLMFHLESIGISKEEKVKPPFSIILLQD